MSDNFTCKTCGKEIDELNYNEVVSIDYLGAIYDFCSPACASEWLNSEKAAGRSSTEKTEYERLIEIPLDNMGFTDEQIEWVMYNLGRWLHTTGGGSFRTLVDSLKTDYASLYSKGGMYFTNAVFDAIDAALQNRDD